jgi:hypothetical protein
MRVPEQDIVTLFRQKFPDGIPPCGLCGEEHWLFDDVLYELRETQAQRLFSREDAKVFPLILITCSNCGNSHMLNALVTKIVVPTPEGQGGK